MKSKVIKTLIGVVGFVAVLFLYPIGKLAVTDAQITQSLFLDEYYAKISSDEYDFNVLRKYMESRGWKENEDKRMGGLHIFERNGETKAITNSQVKTIFIDGKFNF